LSESGSILTKLEVIPKGESFNIMYSLGLLIVELETARRRLLYVFEVPDGTPTSGLRTQAIADGPNSIGLLTRLDAPLDLPRYDFDITRAMKWDSRNDKSNGGTEGEDYHLLSPSQMHALKGVPARVPNQGRSESAEALLKISSRAFRIIGDSVFAARRALGQYK
jgi:hypothetical protein